MYTGKRFLFLFGLCLISTSVFVQIQLPNLISDGIFLQRNQELTIRGSASPSEDVTLTFQGSTFLTTDDDERNWEIKLPPQEAGGSIPERSFSSSNEVTIQLKNVSNSLTTSHREAPQHFVISNDSENSVWAKAEIMENYVKVWHDEISNPAVVRYAWANNPESANLTKKREARLPLLK